MRKMLKRLFKKGEITVYKYGKVYNFKTFEKAVAFMIAG